MTIAEIIELLKTLPQDKVVIVDGCFYDCSFDQVEIEEDREIIYLK